MKTSMLMTVMVLMNMAPVCLSETIQTPEELYRLMEASRARYAFIQAEIIYNGYKPNDQEGGPPIRKAHKEITMTKTPHMKMVDVEMTLYDESAGRKFASQEVFFYSPAYDQYFRRNLSDDHKTGQVLPTGKLRGEHFYTVHEAIWGACSYGWTMLTDRIDNASLEYDVEHYRYIVALRIHDKDNAPWLRLYVDPAKDFVPVQGEILFADKRLFVREETSHWIQQNGLWVPLQYRTSFHLPDDKSWGEYTVQSIVVNKPVAEDIRYSFPPETVVEDEIRGVRYTVDAAKSSSNGQPADTSGLTANLTPPATDAQLAQRTLEAQGMLAKEKQAAAATPPVVPIEIVPHYVWVLDGINDYPLSVTAAADTAPVLVSRSFEGDGLILHALDTQLLTAGTIRVKLERPADLTAYADGVLTLTFSDQTAIVHFVAAPVLKES